MSERTYRPGFLCKCGAVHDHDAAWDNSLVCHKCGELMNERECECTYFKQDGENVLHKVWHVA